MKIAASLDGQSALPNGKSQWITSELARADGHSWRARSDAILTGIGTVLLDDPLLNVRLVQAQHQPALVVVDSRLETPLNARLFHTARAVHIYFSAEDSAKKSALERCGATVTYMPSANGKVDLLAMMHDLAARQIMQVHVEAGYKLNGSMIKEGLVDELLIYLAPKLLGDAQGMALFGPLQDLAQAMQLEFVEIKKLGVDLFIRAKVLRGFHI